MYVQADFRSFSAVLFLCVNGPRRKNRYNLRETDKVLFRCSEYGICTSAIRQLWVVKGGFSISKDIGCGPHSVSKEGRFLLR